MAAGMNKARAFDAADEARHAKLVAKSKAESEAAYRSRTNAYNGTGPGMTAFEAATGVIRSHGLNCPTMISLSQSGQDDVGDVYLAACSVPNKPSITLSAFDRMAAAGSCSQGNCFEEIGH
jgi:hypothetical protein